MPRRKSNLSQYGRNAKRMRLARSQESEEDREARLSATREHQATIRAAETSTQRESRLSSNRSRMNGTRNNEKQRNTRLYGDHEAHALSRESETFADSETRLSSQRVRTSNARSQETQDERITEKNIFSHPNDVADVRRKWSHIRNSYSRHLRNEMHGACTSKGRMVSRWYLADELEFLREHMATDISKLTRNKKGLFLPKKTTEDVQRSTPYSSYAPTLLEMDLNETSNSDPVDVKPFINNPWFALNSPHSPKFEAKPPSVQNDDSSSSFAPDENSSFFQFFRGIHNDYLELPPKKQRLFKRKSLCLLHELLDEEEGEQSNYNDNALNLSNSAQTDEFKDQKPHIEENFILPNN